MPAVSKRQLQRISAGFKKKTCLEGDIIAVFDDWFDIIEQGEEVLEVLTDDHQAKDDDDFDNVDDRSLDAEIDYIKSYWDSLLQQAAPKIFVQKGCSKSNIHRNQVKQKTLVKSLGKHHRTIPSFFTSKVDSHDKEELSDVEKYYQSDTKRRKKESMSMLNSAYAKITADTRASIPTSAKKDKALRRNGSI
jgi:hypothetical protein